jgi:D-alanyl-D-alanine carboxypeptidase
MRNTTFRNASGLHDPKQVSTARDMALLAQYVINHYPGYYKYYNRQSFTYQGKTYKNHNKLLGKYKGMDGMKTGYVRASGFNLIGSAVRNNRRIIGVVFGGRSGKTRNEHMADLLDRGFEKMNTIRVAHARVPLPQRKPRMLLAMNEQGSRDDSLIRVRANQKMGDMGALIGEGDYDLDKVRRIETGMIAIAAHTGRDIQKPRVKSPIMQHAAISSSTQRLKSRDGNGWSVQIGAFGSRSATDDLLHQSLGRLPASSFGNVRTVIAPLKTQDGWLFRGRLGGMSKQQALAACAYFSECMPIAPGNQ